MRKLVRSAFNLQWLIPWTIMMIVAGSCVVSPDLQAAQANQPDTAASTSILPGSNIIKITSATPAAALKGRSENDILELPSGRQLRMGDLRRFSKKATELKAAEARMKAMPQVFKIQPAAKGFALKTGSDLSEALKRPDSETIVLPSGRRATVAQIKFLQPYLEKRLGHKLAQAKLQATEGGVFKVQSSTDRTYWKNILQKSDNTVLEAPDGTRITVGELKQTLATFNTARSASPRISK
jgi:hypothetical protein